MKVQKVDSSMIKKVGHDILTNTGWIKYHNGRIYEYKNVAREDMDTLATAESVGKHFHKHFRPKYEGVELDLEKDDPRLLIVKVSLR